MTESRAQGALPAGGGELERALALQARVIHALILREVKTRFGRNKLGYLWALLEPLLFVSIFALIFSARGNAAPSGMQLLPFLVTGMTGFLFFRNCMDKTMSAISGNRPLLTFPQVTLFDVVVARALLEVATMAIVLAALLIGLQFVGTPIGIENPMAVVGFLLLMALFGVGMGTGFGAIGELMPTVLFLVAALISRPMFFISGMFFTAEMMGAELRTLLLLNPLLHMMEGLRSAFFLEFESPFVSTSYAVSATLCVLVVGLLLQRALRKRILIAS